MPPTRITSASENGSGRGSIGLPPKAERAAQLDSVGRVRLAANRNRVRIASGALLVVACALAAALVYGNVSHRRPVLVVAHSVAAGQVIKDADLSDVLASADAGAGLVAASARDRYVGQVAAVDLVAGSVLSPRQVTAGHASTTGQAVIGVTPKDGQYPLDLSDGDRVWLVQLPAEAADITGGSTSAPATVDAVVVAVRGSSDGGGANVSLAVPPSDAPSLAVAAARGRISIVERPR